MNAEMLEPYTAEETLLGSIGENHRHIKILLKKKAQTIKQVQSAMDQKARTKTPLNKCQQRMFYEFSGLYAHEGGKLQKSLVRIEHIQSTLHTEQSVLLQLLLLQTQQTNAIRSLRRMIASCEETLDML